MKKNFTYLGICLFLGATAFSSCKINKSLNDAAQKQQAQKQEADQNIQNIKKAEQETQRGQPMRE